MSTQTKAKEIHSFLSTDKGMNSVRGMVELKVYDGAGNQVDTNDAFKETFTGDDGFIWNQTLETAKKVFSRVAAGDMAYKIGKIAFGNAGHNFSNPKAPIPATVADEELLSIKKIKLSLNDADDAKHFIFQDTGGTNHRMVYIEKDITSEHITYGPNDNQLIINVPISDSEFNARDGASLSNDTKYTDDLISYRAINPADGTLMEFGNVDASGVKIKDFTEVHSWDDNGTQRFSFKNGLNSSGAIDTANGGYRPQEISEISLSTDIIGDGSAENPYQKIATSRMTNGLLSFPDDFKFVYSWTLSWDFS